MGSDLVAPRGRPPKPIEEKRRTGNPGKRPLPVPVTDLVPARGVPAPPVALGRHGRLLWDGVWTKAQAWISPDLDIGTVELAAVTFDFIEQCRSIISDQGLTLKEPIVTPTGDVVGERIVAHPLIKEQRAAEKQLGSWLQALALTPSDRARLGLAQVKAQSVLEKLVESRQRKEAVGRPSSTVLDASSRSR